MNPPVFPQRTRQQKEEIKRVRISHSIKIFLFFGCVSTILTLLLHEKAIASVTGNEKLVGNNNIITTTTKLADGCYHILLDVGANIGIHARFLFEPDLYPDSKTSVATFAKEFGSQRDNRDYCVFSFEPNPKFEQRHLALEKAYAEMGWRYTPIFAGASNEDGNFTFFHTHMEKAEQETGFSALASKTLYGTDATPKIVPIIRLASWIQKEVEGRQLPTPHSNTTSEPKVIMKLDIEGLEFKVFPDLLTTGALCNNIHFLMGKLDSHRTQLKELQFPSLLVITHNTLFLLYKKGEFHYAPGNHNYYPMNLTADGKHALNIRKEGEQLAKGLLRMIDITDGCMTRYSLDDDESYKNDPHDLPSPIKQ